MSGSPVVFVKLGGSLVTNKRRAYTARRGVIRRLAREVRRALDEAPDLRLLIGHGSGSFGHWAARPYGTRQGAHSPAQWRGYADVAAAAARLNRIVTDALWEAGVPVLALQPSASARCCDGVLQYLDTRVIHAALEQRLVPLLYGDVALDDVRGGTIISTEDIFLFLTGEFYPSRILLLGDFEGVLNPAGSVIRRITPEDLTSLGGALVGSGGVDVTGGMADKVAQMVKLVQQHRQTCVHVLSGRERGLLARVLLDPDVATGTRIVAD